MRERLSTITTMATHRRITPAHAGKTPCKKQSRKYIGDHPRACGKDHGLRVVTPDEKGSPPRMRERQPRACMFNFGIGITPAHAGKTDHVIIPCGLCWDHPRTCGKDLQQGEKKRANWGSPPHMRERHLKIPTKWPFL